jgi:hypothetical protein
MNARNDFETFDFDEVSLGSSSSLILRTIDDTFLTEGILPVEGELDKDNQKNKTATDRTEKLLTKENTSHTSEKSNKYDNDADKKYKTGLFNREIRLSEDKLIEVQSNHEQFLTELLLPMKKRNKFNQCVLCKDFDFFELSKTSMDGIKAFKTVSIDHFQPNAAICDITISNRITFLDMKKLLKSKEIRVLIKTELENDRHQMMDTIRMILDDLFVHMSSKAGIRNLDGSECKNLKQINAAFRKCKSIAEAEIFWQVFYNFNKTYPNWQLETAASAMIIRRWIYDPVEFKNGNRFTFAEKLVTFVLTAVRKSLNQSGKTGCPGFVLTNMLRKNETENYYQGTTEATIIKKEYIRCLYVSHHLLCERLNMCKLTKR